MGPPINGQMVENQCISLGVIFTPVSGVMGSYDPIYIYIFGKMKSILVISK